MMEQWEYIKGLGWIDVQPQRALQMRCRDCGLEWASEYTATEAKLKRHFPHEPVPSYCGDTLCRLDETDDDQTLELRGGRLIR